MRRHHAASAAATTSVARRSRRPDRRRGSGRKPAPPAPPPDLLTNSLPVGCPRAACAADGPAHNARPQHHTSRQPPLLQRARSTRERARQGRRRTGLPRHPARSPASTHLDTASKRAQRHGAQPSAAAGMTSGDELAGETPHRSKHANRPRRRRGQSGTLVHGRHRRRPPTASRRAEDSWGMFATCYRASGSPRPPVGAPPS